MNVREHFVISGVQSEYLSPGLRYATVKVVAVTDVESGILEHVTLGLSIEVKESVTPEDLNEAIIKATVSRLSSIVKCFQGRRAKDFFGNIDGADFFPLPKVMTL